MRDWFRSLRTARHAQDDLLRSLVGWHQVVHRETRVTVAWPKCAWTWRAVVLPDPADYANVRRLR